MAKDYARRYKKKKTRLAKLEEKRNLKQAILFGFLSIFLILLLIFIGFPALIKFVVLLGEHKSSRQKIEKTDILAPNSPTFEPLPEATNSATISLRGFSIADSTVKIVLNGESITETAVNSEGEFETTPITLQEGKNKIKAKAIDKENNESDFSEEIIVLLDTESPELEITSPQDGDKFFDKDKEIKVAGVTEKDAAVFVNNHLVTTDFQNSFSINLELNEGENALKIKAIDRAGNATEKQIKVSYTP